MFGPDFRSLEEARNPVYPFDPTIIHIKQETDMLRQLSIFAENHKGALQEITGLLAEAKINILGSVTNDSAEFGIVRMIVSDPVLAASELEKKGYQCRITSVIGVELADEPGNLNRLLIALSESNVNVDYIYLSFGRKTGMPILIFKTEDALEVEEVLTAKGFKPVGGVN